METSFLVLAIIIGALLIIDNNDNNGNRGCFS